MCIYIENVTFSRFWTCGPIHEKRAKVYNDNGYDYHHDSRPYGLEKLFRQYLLIFISVTKRGKHIFMSLFCSLAIGCTS